MSHGSIVFLLLLPLAVLPTSAGHAGQCGGAVTLAVGQSVILQSPEYPLPYPNNAHCLWTVTSSANGIQMAVDHYDVEHYEPGVCPDNLTIATPAPYAALGCAGPMPRLAKFGSHQTPFQFTVEFNSDDKIQRTGFSLTLSGQNVTGARVVQPACGRQLRLRHLNRPMQLASHNWPFNYPSNSAMCDWTVVNQVVDSVVRVDVEDMLLDSGIDLTLTDTQNNRVVHRYTGGVPSLVNRTVRFDGNELRLRLWTNTHSRSSWSNGRFRLSVTAVPRQKCKNHQLRCPSPGSTSCVSIVQLCDGTADCEDGMDERLSLCQTIADCGMQSVPLNVDPDDKDIGGGKARSGSWPWMATAHDVERVGDAVLLSPRWLLTSSEDNHTQWVRLGSKYIYQDEEPWTVKETVQDNYDDPSNSGFRLLMLKNSIPVPFNDRINVACIPYVEDEDLDSTTCITVGNMEWYDENGPMRQILARRFYYPYCLNYNTSDTVCSKYPDSDLAYAMLTGAALMCKSKAKHGCDDRCWKLIGMHTSNSEIIQYNVFALSRVLGSSTFIYQTMLDAEYQLSKEAAGQLVDA